MTKEQLRAIGAAGESELVEFKKSSGERKEGCQTVCAMLNHRGGRVYFGVDPAGHAVGQSVVDKTIEDITQEIKLIDPPVFPTLDRVPVDGGKEIVVVTVCQGPSRPYAYKGQAYKRVGNTSPPMSRDEYNRMLLERMHGERRWENEIAEGWTIADLEADEIIRTVEEGVRRGRMEDPNTRDIGQLLMGMGLRKADGLLRAAIALFGRRERLEAEVPQCLLRIARFKGHDKTEFVDNRQVNGNAFRLLQRAERFLRDNLPIAGRVVPNLFEREDDPLYPPVALREALANAICHRDYSIGGGSVAVAIFDDRLEITSSGTLHFGLTAEQLYLPHESLPWNPLMARIFHRRGIIEQWGRGTIKIVELAERAGLERPQIGESAGCVTVSFRRPTPESVARRKLTPRQLRIFELIQKSKQARSKDLRDEIRPAISASVLKDELKAIRLAGMIVAEGRGPAAVWKVGSSGNKRDG